MQAHVLLVDDEEGPREALKFSLERKNKWWTITEAQGVDEARRILESPPGPNGPVDVVLTDLVMGREHPEGGLEVLEIAKKKDPFTMVILFTAHDKLIDLKEAYQEGAYDCIEKNILGTVAAKEISTKANAAIHFRQMLLARLKHQEQFTTLRRFFDPRVVRAVIDRPSFQELKMRPVTVVYWDIRGFAALCQRLESRPDFVRGFLYDYYKAITAVVFRHNGILDKFLGNTVMALFCGFGPAGGDFESRSAGDAAEAALMMREVAADLLRKWQGQWGESVAQETLGLVTVLHTGTSLVGQIGIEIHGQFSAVGPNVGFAARLLDRTQPGQIAVSQATADKLAGRYDIAEIGTVDDIACLPGTHALHDLRGKKPATD